MAPIIHATLTDFLRDPNNVVEKLDQNDVVLHRRNASDLRLSLQARSEAGDEGLRFIARFIGAAFADDSLRERLVESAMVVPWVTVLPPGDRQRFAEDLIRSAEAAGELGSMAPVSRHLAEWKATAATYAHPAPAGQHERPTTAFGGRRSAPPGA